MPQSWRFSPYFLLVVLPVLIIVVLLLGLLPLFPHILNYFE